MEHLAKQLASDIRLLSHYLEAVGHPHPSFDRQAPPTALPEGAPENIQLSRERIIDNALQLFNLAAGPREFLINLSTGVSWSWFISCRRLQSSVTISHASVGYAISTSLRLFLWKAVSPIHSSRLWPMSLKHRLKASLGWP